MRTLVRAALVLVALVLAGCSSSDPRGTTERCDERAIELVLDGDPRVVALPEARSIGTCGRGDRSAEIAIRIAVPAVNAETSIVARSDSGDELVLVAQARCGDPTSIFSCVASARGEDETQLTLPPEGEVFVLVRAVSGRASNVTLRARSRTLHRIGEACDPASAAPGCASDPACPATDRCRDGLVCVDGACRGATVGIGGSCAGVQRCQPELACVGGLCVSAIGGGCDLGPAFCSGEFGFVCLDEICRGVFAEQGERCLPIGAPTCSGSLVCMGEPGAQICVDVVGLTCDAAEVLPVSTVDAPIAPLSFTIDPASPSEHASACAEGTTTPDRVFEVRAASSGPLHIALTSSVGPPPLVHVRGPSACDQFSGGCAQRGEITLFADAEPWFVIVEGGGEHTIHAVRGEAIAEGAACDVDPHRFCDFGFDCVSGVCRAVSDVGEGGLCYCSPGGVRDPALLVSRLRGVLAPGAEQWFQFNPTRSLTSLGFESIVCPLDLEVEIFDGSASCEMARCTPTMLDTLGSAALADGTSCTSADVALTRDSPFDVRFRIRSVMGGEYELSVTAPP